MIENILKNRYYFLIILISIIWISFFDYILQLNKQHFIFPDSENYKESASYLYNNLKPHYFRPLVMAIITGLPYLFKYSDTQIYIFSFYTNLFCWIGTSMLLFTLLKDFLSDKKSFFYTCIYLSLTGSTIIIFHLLTESIFTFIIMLAYFFIFKYYKTSEFYFLTLSLSLIIISTLIKPGILFLTVLLLLFYIKPLVKNFFKISIFYILFSLSIVVLQLIEMKKEYGNYTISYIDGFTYYNYLGNKATALKNNAKKLNYDRARANYFTKKTYNEQRKLVHEDLKNQLQNNSKNLIKAYAYNLLENTKTPSASINKCYNIENTNTFNFAKNTFIVISKWQNRILTSLGVVLAFLFLYKSEKKNPFYALISIYILYIFFTSGISFGEGDRFHIVFFPAVILLLAKFINDGKKLLPSNPLN